MAFAAAAPDTTPSWIDMTATFHAGGTGRQHQYQPFNDPLTWAAARDACVAWGGDLVSIGDAQEEQQVLQLMAQPATVWIGLNDRDLEGSFIWSDNSPNYYTNWAPGEPNDGGPGGWWWGGEDCVQLAANVGLRWNDYDCEAQFGYVCERVATIQGADLLVWDEGGWRPVASNAQSAVEPGLLRWTASADQIPRLLYGPAQQFVFAVQPTAPNGDGRAQVAIDYAEAVVRYRP